MILIVVAPRGGIQDSDSEFGKLLPTKCISSSMKDTE